MWALGTILFALPSSRPTSSSNGKTASTKIWFTVQIVLTPKNVVILLRLQIFNRQIYI